MAMDWSVFAEEIGRTGEKLSAGIGQLAGEKRAEKRALRMHRKRLEIEEPFKELSSDRILQRQKDIEGERLENQKNLILWQGKLNRGLDIFAGSEGWKKVIEKARKDGGLSQTAIMQMEDVIMRLRQGDVPEDRDMAVFEALDAFDRLPVMDLFKQNKMYRDKAARADRELDIESNKLQGILNNREAIDRNREQLMAQRYMNMRKGVITGVEKAETEFSEYRSELFSELEDTNKINAKGEAFATIGGRKKVKLLDDAGVVDTEAVKKFVKKFKRYKGRFDRLEVLRGNRKQRRAEAEAFFGGVPTGEPTGEPTEEVPEEWIKAVMDEQGLSREEAIAAYRRFKRK